MGRYLQGRYKPLNPAKYKGDINNIIYRSSWELKFLRNCDTNPRILQYSSEEVIIPYKSPIDGRWHRYFCDFLVVAKNPEGLVKTFLIEVKPAAQTKEPLLENRLTKTGKLSPRFIKDVQTYGINKAKWAAAEEYCKDRGWEFSILTEHHLFAR